MPAGMRGRGRSVDGCVGRIAMDGSGGTRRSRFYANNKSGDNEMERGKSFYYSCPMNSDLKEHTCINKKE